MPPQTPELKRLKEKGKKIEKKLKIHHKQESLLEKELIKIKSKEKKININ